MIANPGEPKKIPRVPRNGSGRNDSKQRFDGHGHLNHQLPVLFVRLRIRDGMARDFAARLGVIAPADEVVPVRHGRERAV